MKAEYIVRFRDEFDAGVEAKVAAIEQVMDVEHQADRPDLGALAVTAPQLVSAYYTLEEEQAYLTQRQEAVREYSGETIAETIRRLSHAA